MDVIWSMLDCETSEPMSDIIKDSICMAGLVNFKVSQSAPE